MGALNISKSIVDSFEFFFTWADAVGDDRLLKSDVDIPRSSVSNIVLVTKGSCRYAPFDGSFEPFDYHAGETNQTLPDIKAGVTYQVSALTADMEFFCVNRIGHGPFASVKFDLNAGDTLTIPKGRVALLGGGELDIGASPRIIHAELADVNAVVLKPCFGLLLELL